MSEMRGQRRAAEGHIHGGGKCTSLLLYSSLFIGIKGKILQAKAQ
jgi:hypothetical protein